MSQNMKLLILSQCLRIQWTYHRNQAEQVSESYDIPTHSFLWNAANSLEFKNVYYCYDLLFFCTKFFSFERKFLRVWLYNMN